MSAAPPRPAFDPADPLLSCRFVPWKLMALGWILALAAAHLVVPPAHTITVAVVASVTMNVTYPVAAVRSGRYRPLELAVAGVLGAVSLVSLVGSQYWVIGAILAHAVWDVLKQNGTGVPFMRWYTNSCAWVDVTYAAGLILYLTHIGG